jgi:group I intron endonuclease
MKTMHYIYKITNKINSKIYIGQTNNTSLRWSQHKSNAKHNRGQQIITRAISKYGVDNFDFDVIASCKTQEDTNLTEEQIIFQYDSRNLEKGYNVDAGGNTTPRTPEVSEKISKSLQQHYKIHSGWNKGGTLTEEWKNKISESHKGLPGTNTGKTFSDEWKMKISKSQIGKERKNIRRFSEDIEKEICRLYVEEEKSMYALGKQFNCYRTLIDDILNRYGTYKRERKIIKNGRNIFTQEREIEICDLFVKQFVNMVELAKKFDCGKTTIRGILLRNNVNLKRTI